MVFGDAAERARWLSGVRRRLFRWDSQARRGPWTRVVLGLIADRPGVSAVVLAGELGRPVSRVKSDVWKLRECGLVVGSPAGYELSAGGRVLLAEG